MSKKVSINGQRFYQIDGVNYPSISTIANAFQPKFSLYAWQKRVGKEAAREITEASAKRGTSLHKSVEFGKTTAEKPEYQKLLDTHNELVKPHIKVIKQEEEVLFYEEASGIRFCGTMDLLAKFRHRVCVMDYKFSDKPKKLDFCYNYFLQLAGYAIAYEEQTGTSVPTGCVINVHNSGVEWFHLSTVNFIYFKQAFLDAVICFLRYQDALTVYGENFTKESTKILRLDKNLVGKKIYPSYFYDWNKFLRNSPLKNKLIN